MGTSLLLNRTRRSDLDVHSFGVHVEDEMKVILSGLKKILVYPLSCILVLTTLPNEGAWSQQITQSGTLAYTGQGAPLSTNELQQLVAPIALYPDALVAQILGAATFPDQVAAAQDWLQENKNLSGQALMQAVNSQQWEPSVKALTQFPTVMQDMTKNISWTSSLGEAYHTQAAAIMTAIQTLRAEAQAAGNLKSGSQITVVQQSPQTIVIQPANPQVVYVPQYNPTVVYGTPYVTPGYSTAAVVTTGLLMFGAGIAVGAAINNSCCGWGYSSWNCNWHGGAVYYGGGAYYGNNAWHGGVYGSSATAYGPNGVAHASQGYNPSTGTYARGGSVSTPYGSAAAGQAYNPRTGASASTVQGSNANGSYGASTVSKNGNTAYGQHQTTSQGTTAQAHTTNGGNAYGASGKNGNSAAAGETASGNKYASANGNEYKNTGSGWEKNSNGSWNSVQKPSSSSANGYGQHDSASHSSAFGGGGSGWQSREASARGSASRGGGGGWGGRR